MKNASIMLSFTDPCPTKVCFTVHEIRRVEKISSCSKNGVFFTACSWEKDTIFGAAWKMFGSSYSVMALAHFYLPK